MPISTVKHPDKNKKFLSFSAAGVVFAAIGITPLYTLSQLFFGSGGTNLLIARDNVYGATGFIIWAITLIVAVKYMLLFIHIHRADAGGMFALTGSIADSLKRDKKITAIMSTLLIIAAGLLLGDTVMAPSFSVLSAVEGLKIAAPALSPYVIPLTLLILTTVFLVQQDGSVKTGYVFGPILVIWFGLLGLLGINSVLKHPEIINALHPINIVNFVMHSSFDQVLFSLSAVALAVVGTEVLYAGIGGIHEKRNRFLWFLLVYPALIINYLGQGAFLLSGQTISENNIFFSMIPGWAISAVMLLAITASIITAQSFISFIFSFISQMIALHLFPRMKVIRILKTHGIQVYIPGINWFLYTGSVAFILFFQTVRNMAWSYGLATTGAMVISTCAVFVMAATRWRWGFVPLLLLLSPVFFIDTVFFGASLIKLTGGAHIPLSISLIFILVMKIWEWGREHIEHAVESYHTITVKDLVHKKISDDSFTPQSVIIMMPKPVLDLHDHIPSPGQLFIGKSGYLPKNIIFLTVVERNTPYMHRNRYEINHFYRDYTKGQVVGVQLNFGFLEEPDVRKQLVGLAAHHKIAISDHPDTWLIHVLEEHFAPSKSLSVGKTLSMKLFEIFEKNSLTVGEYFGLGNVSGLTSEFLQVKIAA